MYNNVTRTDLPLLEKLEYGTDVVPIAYAYLEICMTAYYVLVCMAIKVILVRMENPIPLTEKPILSISQDRQQHFHDRPSGVATWKLNLTGE